MKIILPREVEIDDQAATVHLLATLNIVLGLELESLDVRKKEMTLRPDTGGVHWWWPRNGIVRQPPPDEPGGAT